ncbi:Uncharacterised protein [Mycobacteroides abscessus subsp. massiliense]|nr:Uncharacterised protein [Mycobacteroides abscessus subsp. massiliense]
MDMDFGKHARRGVGAFGSHFGTAVGDFLALFLGNHHHIDAGTARYTQQQHFHRAGAALDFAFSRRAFHHNAVSICRCTDEAHSVYPF